MPRQPPPYKRDPSLSSSSHPAAATLATVSPQLHRSRAPRRRVLTSPPHHCPPRVAQRIRRAAGESPNPILPELRPHSAGFPPGGPPPVSTSATAISRRRRPLSPPDPWTTFTVQSLIHPWSLGDRRSSTTPGPMHSVVRRRSPSTPVTPRSSSSGLGPSVSTPRPPCSVALDFAGRSTSLGDRTPARRRISPGRAARAAAHVAQSPTKPSLVPRQVRRGALPIPDPRTGRIDPGSASSANPGEPYRHSAAVVAGLAALVEADPHTRPQCITHATLFRLDLTTACEDP